MLTSNDENRSKFAWYFLSYSYWQEIIYLIILTELSFKVYTETFFYQKGYYLVIMKVVSVNGTMNYFENTGKKRHITFCIEDSVFVSWGSWVFCYVLLLSEGSVQKVP